MTFAATTTTAVSKGALLDAVASMWMRASGLWKAGARSVLPAPWFDALLGGSSAIVVLRREDDGVRCRLVGESKDASVFIADPSTCLSALDDWLRWKGIDRAGLRVSVALERRLFLVRSFLVPNVALATLPTVLDQEILHRTPFRLDEILQGARQSRQSGGMHAIEQWIIRRDRARDALRAFGVDETDVDFLAVDGADAVVPMRARAATTPSKVRRLLAAGVVLSVVTTSGALAAWDWREATLADSIGSRVDEARAMVKDRGGDPVALAGMLARKANPGTLGIWEELSRVLPDDTYLREIRIADDTVTITGFSSHAADLVRILDGSPLFARAALTGPIEPNASEGKDRFSLSVDLRSKPARSSRNRAQAPSDMGAIQ